MEVWLPRLEVGLFVLLPAGLLIVAFRMSRTKHPKGTIAVRIVSLFAALPFWFLSLFLLVAQGYEEDRPIIASPDGRHIARLMIWGSIPSGTSLQVIERRSWSPTWRVISTAGSEGRPLDPIEPRITWLDNRRLLIDYPEPSDGSGSFCVSGPLGEVELVCTTHTSTKK